MKTVVVTNMMTGVEKTHYFATVEEARSFFLEICDTLNLDYQPGDNEAGGRGYDYRAEIK